MKQVKIKDKEFRLSYPEAEIQNDIDWVASKINHDFAKSGDIPVFVSVLNGSFMFTADLLKRISIPCEITFVKLASYQGTSTTGKVNQLIGINEDVTGRSLVVLEDIVDTGITLSKLYEELRKLNPKEIRVATLLFKPDAYKGNIKLDYIGRSIPNDFIVGYGLDYDGLGRNLQDIYTLI
jgi:hypoxanthine phosphoribosyltransferase